MTLYFQTVFAPVSAKIFGILGNQTMIGSVRTEKGNKKGAKENEENSNAV